MSAFNAQEQAAVTETAECVVFGDATLYRADCIALMRTLPDSSVDSIVTDPPYGISFMGKAWDGADIEARTARRRGFASHAPNAGPNGGHKSIAAEAGKYDLAPAAMRAFQEFSEEWAREALRVLKPGGHLLSFSSARTYHRMVSGIEDAGFEIRDQIMWLFGSGFPKAEIWTEAKATAGQAESATMIEAGFEGWARGGLKPAHEPICVARKPLIGPVATNVLAHGTGAINVDACRVHADDALGGAYTVKRLKPGAALNETGGNWRPQGADAALYHGKMAAGRFPANIIHDGSDEVLAAFPDAAGQQGDISYNSAPRERPGIYGSLSKGRGAEPSADSENDGAVGFKMKPGARRLDIGSAARFFYCAKASRADRNAGLDNLGPIHKHGATLRHMDNAVRDSVAKGNIHPTVKPTDLIAYLQRLVTPPGGTTLDLFMGSGTGAKAAVREGFKFIGFEISAEYFPIAVARTRHEVDAVAAAVIADAAAAKELARQADLFAEREA